MIGIIITSILRDHLLSQNIEALKKYWQDSYYPIIIDQNGRNDVRNKFVEDVLLDFEKKYGGRVIFTDFDIGPLKARNIAIKHLRDKNIPYLIMSADSILFNDIYNFDPVISLLEEHKDNLLCGFNIKHRLPWEGTLEIQNGKFLLDIPRQPNFIYAGMSFQPVDICRNFFLAKTHKMPLYDEDRIMADHESFFWRAKQLGYRCYYSDSIEATYKSVSESEYNKYRARFSTELVKMQQKYNLTGWIKYTPEMKQVFKKYKNKKNY
jgi:hypothetical protein